MSTKNKKSNSDKTLKFNLWQSLTTLVFTRPINLVWNKTEEKTDFEKKKKKSIFYNTKNCDKTIEKKFNRTKKITILKKASKVVSKVKKSNFYKLKNSNTERLKKANFEKV